MVILEWGFNPLEAGKAAVEWLEIEKGDTEWNINMRLTF